MRRVRYQNNEHLVEQRLGNHLKKTNPLLFRSYRSYIEPYIFLCTLTAVLCFFIAISCYSFKYSISFAILWESNKYTLIFLFITFITLFASIIILAVNSIIYVKNNIQELDNIYERKKLKIFSALILLLTLISTTLKLFDFTNLSFIVSIIFLIVLLITQKIVTRKHSWHSGALLFTFIFFTIYGRQFLLFYEIDDILLSYNIDKKYTEILARFIGLLLTCAIIYGKIPENVSPKNFRTQQTRGICGIAIISAVLPLNFLLNITYTGGGLPIQIIQDGKQDGPFALLVMDRENDFIAFDKETQSSKIYNKSKVSWELVKPNLNSENNSVTMRSTQEG